MLAIGPDTDFAQAQHAHGGGSRGMLRGVSRWPWSHYSTYGGGLAETMVIVVQSAKEWTPEKAPSRRHRLALGPIVLKCSRFVKQERQRSCRKMAEDKLQVEFSMRKVSKPFSVSAVGAGYARTSIG